MPTTASDLQGQRVLPAYRLTHLFDVLHGQGYEVLGPTVRDGVVVVDVLDHPDDLPHGWGDEQDGGHYRLRPRGDDAYFGFAAPAGSWKRHLLPPRSVLWRARLSEGVPEIEPADEPVRRRAFLGMRGCDLAALGVLDRVLHGGADPDPVYSARRDDVLLVGVSCGWPAATCFCTSMGTGPSADAGADITLTELDPGDTARHRFLVVARTDQGSAVVDALTLDEAVEADVAAAEDVVADSVRRMGRSMDTTDLPALLRASAEHPRWEDVASRCLSCGSCTLACPTCFCTDVRDEPSPLTAVDERVRVWASCFEQGHSYLHGGSVRVSPHSRYRQWMTHKLSTWWDQFGSSGCVGCGRCITWCPVGIDITDEVRAIRGDDAPRVGTTQEV